jgi:hypothetical protein
LKKPVIIKNKRDIVRIFMKNRLGISGKTRGTLPLEGGGRRVGEKGGITSINTIRGEGRMRHD